MTGRIISWDPAKGFGYVQCESERLFVRDFAKRHKPPEVGDVVLYSIGSDKQGRRGAKQAVHHNDGGRLRAIHGAILAALLIAPACAA